MASLSLLIPISVSSTPPLATVATRASFRPSHVPLYRGIHFSPRTRGSRVVTRAGPPSTSSLVFAFVLPLSLLAITIFSAIKVADRLDRQFLEEYIVNEAMKEEEEDDDDDDDDDDDNDDEGFVDEKIQEPVLGSTGNRPKREA